MEKICYHSRPSPSRIFEYTRCFAKDIKYICIAKSSYADITQFVCANKGYIFKMGKDQWPNSYENFLINE